MEERETKHIEANLLSLIDNTKVNTTCIVVLYQEGVLGRDDVSHLESIINERQKVWEFYQLIMTKKNSYEHLITALTEGAQSGAVAILNEIGQCSQSFKSEKQISPVSRKRTHWNAPTIAGGVQFSTSIQFNVYKPMRLFSGRVQELVDLHENLQQSKTRVAVISQMASIVGLGGIGKTELARMYIQQYGKYYENNVIWISAETEETLTESFHRLATDYLRLGLVNTDGKEKHIKTVVDQVYNCFDGKQSLFVFDNADNAESTKTFMPLRVIDPPFVLITSRDKEWSYSVASLELDGLKEREAIDFVRNGLELDGLQDEIVTQLVQTLQYFPLAISQAISYIKQQQMLKPYGISEYLQEYESCSVELLGSGIHSVVLSNYTKTTITTWKMTTNLIYTNKEFGKEAMQMLQMISYFHSDRIPTKLLLFPNITSEKTPNNLEEKTKQGFSIQALRLLVKYSMVNIHPEEQIISIHRLVQEVMRIELRQNKQEEETLGAALKLLSGNPKLSSISNFCNVYKFCKPYKDLVAEFKHIPWKILQYLSKTSCHRVIDLNIGVELNGIIQKHVPSDEVLLIRLEYRLADVDHKNANLDIALEKSKQFIPFYNKKETCIIVELEKLDAQNWFSIALKNLGHPISSFVLILQNLKRQETVQGFNNWETAHALVIISNSLEASGDFDKPFPSNSEYLRVVTEALNIHDRGGIISLFKEAYDYNKHLIGSEFIYSFLFSNVAYCLHSIGNREGASIIATDVYELGKNSSDSEIRIISMACLTLLGIFKAAEGKYKEAVEICKNVYNFLSREIPSSDIYNMNCKINLLCILREFGATEAVLDGLREMLEMTLRWCPNSPVVLRTEICIGVTLFKMERYEEGLEVFLRLRKTINHSAFLTSALLEEVNEWINAIQKCFLKDAGMLPF